MVCLFVVGRFWFLDSCLVLHNCCLGVCGCCGWFRLDVAFCCWGLFSCSVCCGVGVAFVAVCGFDLVCL